VREGEGVWDDVSSHPVSRVGRGLAPAAGRHLRDRTIGCTEYSLYRGRGDHRSLATPIKAVDSPNPPARRRPLEVRRVKETWRAYLLIGLRRWIRAKISAIGRLDTGSGLFMLSAVAFVAERMRGQHWERQTLAYAERSANA